MTAGTPSDQLANYVRFLDPSVNRQSRVVQHVERRYGPGLETQFNLPSRDTWPCVAASSACLGESVCQARRRLMHAEFGAGM